MGRGNNWGNWGLLLSVSCAVYLKDEELFKKCVGRWKQFIDTQIDRKGHLPMEVRRVSGRKGLSYSHFCLQAQTAAAEIIRLNGIDLFVSSKRQKLEMAFRKTAGWTRNPSSFPYWKGKPEALNLGGHRCNYFEILNIRWPDRCAEDVLKKMRPLSGSTLPFLTFTHGESLQKENRPE
jgi:hypothetical protein